jgi:hypothetical protein
VLGTVEGREHDEAEVVAAAEVVTSCVLLVADRALEVVEESDAAVVAPDVLVDATVLEVSTLGESLALLALMALNTSGSIQSTEVTATLG